MAAEIYVTILTGFGLGHFCSGSSEDPVGQEAQLAVVYDLSRERHLLVKVGQSLL
jgi:hypothetical protein